MAVGITQAARVVVGDAGARAAAQGDSHIREEHLLAAVLAAPAVLATLRRLDQAPDVGAVLEDISWARRRGGLTTVEVDALTGLGIDVDAVVERVEAALGEGAIDVTVPRRRTQQSWRGPSVSAELNAVLVSAHRQVLARGGRDVDVDHLMLGLLARPGLVADALARHGITLTAALAELEADDPQSGE